MMTLAAFVRNECANFKNGGCLFAQECSVCAGKQCSVSKAVLLGGKPKGPEQDYFAACVVPLAKVKPEYTDAANEYGHICGRGNLAKQRSCACGMALPARHRVCKSCALKARRATKRKCWESTRQLMRNGKK